MSTFREIALAKVEEGIADLQSRGEVLDEHGVLAGAMVDAATIALQDWLRSDAFCLSFVILTKWDEDYQPEDAIPELIREAGKVTS